MRRVRRNVVPFPAATRGDAPAGPRHGPGAEVVSFAEPPDARASEARSNARRLADLPEPGSPRAMRVQMALAISEMSDAHVMAFAEFWPEFNTLAAALLR